MYMSSNETNSNKSRIASVLTFYAFFLVSFPETLIYNKKYNFIYPTF